MDRISALMIQNWPDVDSDKDRGLLKSFRQNEEGKWAAYVHLCKNGGIHMMLISSEPVFDTKQAAEKSLCGLMTEVRAMEL